MAVNKAYTIGSIVVSGTPAFNLDGITQSSANPGAEVLIQRAAGQADPTHVSVISQSPRINWTCTDIATALGSIALSGLPIISTASTSLDMYLTRMQEGGVRASGSVNARIRAVEGLILPRQITVSQGQAATLTCEFIATYDGTNAPFQYSVSSALPHTPSVDELFTMGKIAFNGTTLAGCQSLTIDFGLSEATLASCGNLFPTFAGIATREPYIEVSLFEIDYMNTFGISGTAQSGTDSIVYLQKQSKNANRLAADTAEHISITIDDGIITVGEVGGSNNEPSMVTLRHTGSYDGSNNIWAISTTTTIV